MVERVSRENIFTLKELISAVLHEFSTMKPMAGMKILISITVWWIRKRVSLVVHVVCLVMDLI